MRLSAPKSIVWTISVILGVIGLIGKLVAIPFITAYAFWIVLVGFVLLILGTFLKGF